MNVGIKKDLTGQRFTYFTVIGFDHRNKFGKAMWRVKCDCGTEKVVQGNALVTGNSRSCGCAQRQWMREKCGKFIGELSGAKWSAIKYNAEARKHKIQLTQQEAYDKFIEQDKRCALSGVGINLDPASGEVTASFDRIDSSLDYYIGNVQWVHKTVNLMKNEIPESEFLNWIAIIHNNKNP